jgi:hypothetical protein
MPEMPTMYGDLRAAPSMMVCFQSTTATVNHCLIDYGHLPFLAVDAATHYWPSALVAETLLACTDKAVSGSADPCGVLQGCLGGRYPEPPSAVFEMARCAGKRRIIGDRFSADCSLLHPDVRCYDLPTGVPRATCAKGSCPSGVVTACEGKQRGYTCEDGVPRRVDCSGFDAVCDPLSTCRGNGKRCTDQDNQWAGEGPRVVVLPPARERLGLLRSRQPRAGDYQEHAERCRLGRPIAISWRILAEPGLGSSKLRRRMR